MIETPEEREERISRMAAIGGLPKLITEPVTPDEVAAAKAKGAVKRAMELGIGATKSATELYLSYWGTEELNIRAFLALDCVAPEQAEEAKIRLAEVMIRLGRLAEARELDPSREGYIRKLQSALDAPDYGDCECEEYVCEVPHPTDVNIAPKRKIFPKWQPVDQIFHPTHETLVNVYQCLRCEILNARPTAPAHAAKRQQLAADFPAENQGSDWHALPDAQ